MKHVLGPWILGLGLLTSGCPGDDSSGEGGSGSSSGTAGSSSGGGATVSPTAGMTMGMSGTGSTTMEPSDTTTTMPPGDTTGSTTAPPATDGSSSGGGGSTTGGGSPLYPPCNIGAMPECDPPYDVCYPFLLPDFSVCTLPCMMDADCPQPTTGDAVAVCAGQAGDQCLIDCSGGATCPDGMECQQVGGGMMTFNRCVWPSP